MPETLGERLKFALKIRKIKQKDFAKVIGVHEVSMCRYINDKEKPSADIIVKICLALGISADWLLGLLKKEEEQ